MKPVANIIIEAASPSFDKIYSYIVPQEMLDKLQAGCRVQVPFGRQNKPINGLVLSLEEHTGQAKLKPIKRQLDEEPLLDAEGLFLLRYLHDHTFCMWFDALRVLVPAGLSLLGRVMYSAGVTGETALTARQSELAEYIFAAKKAVSEEKLFDEFALSAGDDDLATLVNSGVILREEHIRQRIMDDKLLTASLVADWNGPLTQRQREVYSFIEENGEAAIKEITYYTGATRAVVDALVKKGAVMLEEQIRQRNPYQNVDAAPTEAPPLSPQQQQAADELSALLSADQPKPAMLYGVTGSGKTQVFLALIEKTVASGRGVIVMVPEISLTSQTVRALHQRFGARVAVLHSALSLGERMDEWRRIKSGGADIVVGTRSAVFAPLQSLGLIVIDEEQEHTYKSEKSPRFHARDVAAARCRYHKALLLLCSATPSLESYYRAKEGRLALLTLEERYGKAILPDVYLVDMNDPENHLNSQYLSDTLLTELRYNLEHGEQSILLLNRRGYSTIIKCTMCGEAVQCPHCSVSMTYHRANDSIICHYCGYTQNKANTCPVCQSEVIRYSGAGTQRLEEELAMLFPQARLLRMDMDTTMSKFSHERMFTAFSEGEYDILIGTQMVAKGLNFPNVTLVGVLSADQSLYSEDFRSYERTFSLLTQVVGRSGRGEAPGRAFIQTWTPEHPIISFAARQDYNGFYSQEILSRRLHLYPPFCAICGIGFSGEAEREVVTTAHAFSAKLAEIARERYSGIPLRLLGPSPAEVLRVAGKYRYKLLVKCRQSKETRALLREAVDWFYGTHKKVSITVDL